MAGRVFLAVFLCLAAIMEDQIKVEGWELEALEESLVCYKPTREICGVCGVGTVTAVSRSAQKSEMIIYTNQNFHSILIFVPNVWGGGFKIQKYCSCLYAFRALFKSELGKLQHCKKRKEKKAKRKTEHQEEDQL